MSRAPTLVIRADASSAVGVGHAMRCLALAQAWQDAGGAAVFAWAELPAPLRDRLQRENVRTVRLPGPVGGAADRDALQVLCRREPADWIAVDGYRFSPNYGAALRHDGARLLWLDDMMHLASYPADLLLNQNLGDRTDPYAGKVGRETELLLGPRHCLLRREFRDFQDWRRPAAHTPRRLLVSFGGGDAENFSARILQKLVRSARTDLEVVVLAGAANPHVPKLRQVAAAVPFPCEIRVNAGNVAEAMAWADFAVTAGGSTVWELAALKLPALVCAVEDNQQTCLPLLRTIPFLRPVVIDDILSGDLIGELDRLLAAPATDCPIDALGSERVVRRMLAHLPPDLVGSTAPGRTAS